jgi:hypothetical protein
MTGADGSLERIQAVLGPAAFRISCTKLRRVRRHIVYAWVRGDRVLYVGMSTAGFLRPLSAGHEVCWAFEDGDALLLWPAADRDEARRLEADAIRLVGPAYNGPNRREQPPRRPDLFDEEEEEEEEEEPELDDEKPARAECAHRGCSRPPYPAGDSFCWQHRLENEDGQMALPAPEPLT